MLEGDASHSDTATDEGMGNGSGENLRNRNGSGELARWAVGLLAAMAAGRAAAADYDVAAFYWPAYHSEARWDAQAGWTDGMGEWQIIRDCRPRFEGHEQPSMPAWGYQDESDPRVMEKKIDAAAHHGVNVFIFDWYWYDNKPFLEDCLNKGFLQARNNDRIRFYLMWANHDASTLWNSQKSHMPGQVIWPGAVDRKTFDTVADRVIERYMKHPSYYKIDGKPVFSIYELGTLMNGLGGLAPTREALDSFRAKVQAAGFPGLHIQAILWSNIPASATFVPGDRSNTQGNTIQALGIDSLTNYQWAHYVRARGNYADWGKTAVAQWMPWTKEFTVPFYPHVSIGWDPNPRYKEFKRSTIVNRSPEAFADFLRLAKGHVDRQAQRTRLITVNAWNEWSEGSYLEPCDRYGMSFLEAVMKVFIDEVEADRLATTASADLPIVPAPQSVTLGQGRLQVGDRIVCGNGELRPLETIVAAEMQRLTGRQPVVSDEAPREGDVCLQLDSSLKGEGYTLAVDSKAAVRGGNYAAVAAGTVSLLQLLSVENGRVTVPRLTVNDAPFAPYRGLMIDAARAWHSPATLKQIVELCRWYKIRYLQVHFTDDQSFMFPSTAFPKLATTNRHYTVAELQDLETYARDRGVAILPELDVPGHASAILSAMPDLFGNNPRGGRVICPGREAVYQALDVLVGEMAAIFRTSPYLHVGADEAKLEPWITCVDCQRYMSQHQLADVTELYRHFIVRMNDIVKKHGKKTIVWEGFHKEGKTDIPRDIAVMVFESKYNISPDLIAQGYPVINTSWQPLYVVGKRNWTPEYIYGWNLYRWENWWNKSLAYGKPIEVSPTNLVLGAQMCAWEQGEKEELPSLRQRVAAMSERIWNPAAVSDFTRFAARLQATDAALDKLLGDAQ